MQLLIFNLLWLFMPDYQPKNRGLSYPRMLLSMLQLIPKYPLLVQQSLNALFLQATLMLYWTTLTFLLASPPYGFSSSVIGMFGLIGTAAVLTTPCVGRFVIDKWHPQLSVLIGSGIVLIGQVVGTYAGLKSVAAPVIQAWMLDLGIFTAQVASRAEIYKLDPGARNRINSVFMLGLFIGQVSHTLISWKSTLLCSFTSMKGIRDGYRYAKLPALTSWDSRMRSLLRAGRLRYSSVRTSSDRSCTPSLHPRAS
ncbi:hypothetical protein ABW21_db0203846 [Orbilia brochopaga]|nr:hypothetical protein ABW21_db0203846 [Drechslerella brochopaga]